MSAAADPETPEDGLLGGRVRLLQPRDGYRAAIDPVVLAAAVPARAGERALDMGAGTGAAALCLAVRVPGVTVEGLERDPALAALANESAARSGLAGRVRVHAGDVADPPDAVRPNHYHHVLTNPPYRAAGSGNAPRRPGVRAAHVEGGVDLAAWLDACLRMVRPRGTLSVIQRADRLDSVIAALAGRLGGLTVIPLWPGGARPAGRVIVRGRKGVRTPAAVLPGLVLHGADGAFTEAAQAVLRDAAPLAPDSRGGVRG